MGRDAHATQDNPFDGRQKTVVYSIMPDSETVLTATTGLADGGERQRRKATSPGKIGRHDAAGNVFETPHTSGLGREDEM